MLWEIFDLVEGDVNAFTDWCDAQDRQTQAKVAARLMMIRSAGLQLPNSVTPTTEKKIQEVELNGKSGAFRVFLCRGPGGAQLTLLGGGREKDTRYVRKRPHIDPQEAERRRAWLMEDLATRRVPHEFEEDYLG